MAQRDVNTSMHNPWRRRLPLLPALLFTVLVTQVPFLMSIWYSLTDWKIVPPGPRTFVGLHNYTRLVSSDERFFRAAAWVTVVTTVGAVLLSLLLGTLFALLLDRAFFGRGFLRTLLITPFLIMPVVAALIWKLQMFNSSYGVLNWLLGLVGAAPVEFVSKHPTASVITVLVWQWTPFMMLIILAGLQGQPSDVLEAAKVDGATPFGVFRQLTIPHLKRYFELGALLGTIYIVQAFDQIAVMTGGGPGSTNIPYFVYQRSIGGGWLFGRSSAYSIVVVLAAVLVANLSLRLLSSLLEGEAIA
jgi:sorbitol/mannitol transport system permease protein